MPDDTLVAIDGHPLQAAFSRGRGIGRYVDTLIRHLVVDHRDLVHSVLVRAGGGFPPELTPLVGLVQPHRRCTPLDRSGRPPTAFLATSPFDLGASPDLTWPRWARTGAVTTAAVVYDLIPARFEDLYLDDPATRAAYWSRLRTLQHFDRLLCISDATRADLVDLTGVPPERVHVIGTAGSPHFEPPSDREAAGEAVRAALPRIRDPFIIYPGGEDPRKNIRGLLAAYARLDPDTRAATQLVVVCGLSPGGRADLEAEADALGIADRLVLTGFVTDATLLALYQAAELLVFPSSYEGFGLPIVEAIQCGTPAVVADVSSMPEIVLDERMRFPPDDPAAMAEVIERALTASDRAALAGAQMADVARMHAWPLVTARLVDALTPASGRTPRRPAAPGRSPTIALITPVPPQETGVADYSWRLADALSSHLGVDLVVESGEAARLSVRSDGLEVVGVEEFHRRDSQAPYADVVYAIGNSDFHHYAVDALERRPGAVLLHEARLTGLFASYARQRGLGRSWIEALLDREYPELELPVGDDGSLDHWEVADAGVFLFGPIVDRATRVLVTNEFMARIVGLERPRRLPDITNVGFGFPPVHGAGVERVPGFVVGTLGIQAETKATDLLIRAFAGVRARASDAVLVLAGQIDQGYEAVLRSLASDLGISESVEFLGRLEPAEYAHQAARFDVGVQLRRTTNGEMSAAVADLLAAGTPAVVTNLGPAGDLPDDAVAKVPRDVTSSELAAVILDLHNDPGRIARMRRASLAHAAARDMTWAAGRFLDALAICHG